MTVFRSEVARSGEDVEVDYASFVGQYLTAAWFLREYDSVNGFKNVTYNNVPFLIDPAKLAEKSGSVTATQDGARVDAASYDRFGFQGAVKYIPLVSYDRSSLIVQVDLKHTIAQADQGDMILSIHHQDARGGVLKLACSRFAAYLQFGIQYRGGINISPTIIDPSIVGTNGQITVPVDGVVTLVWNNLGDTGDGRNLINLDAYYNGSHIYTESGETQLSTSPQVIQYQGLGSISANSNDNFCRYQAIYNKPSPFTALEVDEIVSNPYGVFKTLDESINDNCLKLTSASESISLPLIGAYDVDAYLTDGSTVNFTGSGTLVISGATPREITKVIGNDSNNGVFYDFNRSPATAPVVPELINNQNGLMVGFTVPTSGYLQAIEKQVFTTDDYPDLPTFVTAESSNSDYREYLAGTTAGATISGFSDGVIINGGTVTSPITLTQTGIAQIKNATLDDIDATGATGDVTIIDCGVEDVTG